MPVTISFEVSGVSLLKETLEKIIKAFDLGTEAETVLREFESYQSEWFDSEGRGSWAPLSPSYAEWKNEVAPGAPLLVLTGALRESQWDVQSGSHQLTIKLDAPDYWRFHQFGTVKMPARPPYVLDRQTYETLGKSIIDAMIRRAHL